MTNTDLVIDDNLELLRQQKYVDYSHFYKEYNNPGRIKTQNVYTKHFEGIDKNNLGRYLRFITPEYGLIAYYTDIHNIYILNNLNSLYSLIELILDSRDYSMIGYRFNHIYDYINNVFNLYNNYRKQIGLSKVDTDYSLDLSARYDFVFLLKAILMSDYSCHPYEDIILENSCLSWLIRLNKITFVEGTGFTVVK